MGRRTHSRSAAVALGFVLASVSPALSVVQSSAAVGKQTAPHVGVPVETGQLYGVATAAGGAWAVGYSGVPPDSTKDLTLSWNGTRWQNEPSPSPPDAELRGVAATSPRNVWAVGSSNNESGTSASETVILHRTGTKWALMPSTPGSLSGVATTSATDAWAVGSTNQGDTLILHWNGRGWQRTPSPGVGNLSAVTATSPSNAWAVGSTDSGNTTLILHWDGRTWVQTPSPSVGADQGLGSFLGGVAGSSHHTAWAVGEGDDCGCGPGLSLTARWNGKTWSQVATPGHGGMDLSAVASFASNRAWAVGTRGEGDGPTSGAILLWDGSAWVRVPITGFEDDNGGLSGVAAASRSNAWAVGWESAKATSGVEYGHTGNPDIAILHWNGLAWTALTTAGAVEAPAPALGTTTTTFPRRVSTPTTTPPTTTSAAPVAGGPLLGSAAWGQALGSFGGISGFGEAAPTEISLGGVASAPHVDSIAWSNWGATEATGQGQAIDGTGQSGPVSSWPLKPVTVVAFDLGSCSGGPPAYQEVTWYFPGDGQTFDPNSATNACTGQ